jgi:hypothetical protein
MILDQPFAYLAKRIPGPGSNAGNGMRGHSWTGADMPFVRELCGSSGLF